MHQIAPPLLTISGLSKAFGATPLFSEISLVVPDGERVALIGANGSGKSTLLRILSAQEEADSGEVIAKKGLRMEIVAQEDSFSETTIEEVLFGAVPTEIVEGGGSIESHIGSWAARIGITDRTKRLDTLSGGERKRVAIARACVAEPDLLLLDEPTNHLDIEGIEWLEEFLSAARFSTLFISHDRYFIEHLAERVIELDRRYPLGCLVASGSYSSFLETREAFFEQRESYRVSLANKTRREIEWLRRGAKARTTKAKGRIKQAHALIDELASIKVASRSATLEFSGTRRQTKELIKAEKLGKSFGGTVLFSDVTLVVTPGSRIGITGSNGSGKSTLIKVILGALPPDTGRLVQANNLKLAYFDQERRGLNPNDSLQQALCEEGDSVVFAGRQYHVAGWARRFLFQPEQLRQPVHTLSGGERARVLLARLMLEEADILVLDEPTNDLDIPTLEVLEEALSDFPGAVLMVTHDRHLLDSVCTSVIGILGDGTAPIFADYHQWEAARELLRQELRASEGLSSKARVSSTTHISSTGGAVGMDAPPPKLTNKEQLEFDTVEGRIGALETAITKAQEALLDSSVTSDPDRLRDHCATLAENERELERLFTLWHDLEQKKQRYEEWRARKAR